MIFWQFLWQFFGCFLEVSFGRFSNGFLDKYLEKILRVCIWQTIYYDLDTFQRSFKSANFMIGAPSILF